MQLLKQNATMEVAIIYEPELRFTPSGESLTTFTAIDKDWNVHRCEAWGAYGEHIIELDLKPQTIVILKGSERRRRYFDREDNVEKAYIYFSISILERNKNQNG